MPAIGIGISPYFRMGGGSNYFGDLFPGFVAGYSLRKLSPSATYAIRVRRSSDNSETDIGFVYDLIKNQYELDTATLLTFCGGGNGFVKTWYDQSGNDNHLTQTTSGSQPRIVGTGALDISNGEVAINFDGADDYFSLTSQISDSRPFSIFQVTQRFDATSMSPTLSSSVGGSPFALMEYGDNYYYTRDNNRTVISSSTDTSVYQKVLAAIQNYTSGYLWKNSTVIAVGAPIGVGGVGDFVDYGRRETVYAKGWAQELIFYTSDETSNCISIQNNLGDYWNTFISSNRTNGYKVLVVGQSNGTDRFNQSALPYTSPLNNGWTFYKAVDNSTDNGYWQRQDAGVNTMAGGGTAGNFAWSFVSAKWSIDNYGKALYVVPTALGSTGLDNAYVPGWDPDHVGEYYDRSITNFNQGAAKLSNIATSTVVVIDHGQNDAGNFGQSLNYESNLTDWINAYRTDLGDANLPVIVILLNEDSIYSETATVRQAQVDVVAAMSNVYSIDGNNYPLQDGEHYANSAAVQLGKDIADLINTL